MLKIKNIIRQFTVLYHHISFATFLQTARVKKLLKFIITSRHLFTSVSKVLHPILNYIPPCGIFHANSHVLNCIELQSLQYTTVQILSKYPYKPNSVRHILQPPNALSSCTQPYCSRRDCTLPIAPDYGRWGNPTSLGFQAPSASR